MDVIVITKDEIWKERYTCDEFFIKKDVLHIVTWVQIESSGLGAMRNEDIALYPVDSIVGVQRVK